MDPLIMVWDGLGWDGPSDNGLGWSGLVGQTKNSQKPETDKPVFLIYENTVRCDKKGGPSTTTSGTTTTTTTTTTTFL